MCVFKYHRESEILQEYHFESRFSMVERSRWTMLGHELRLPENSLAALALRYALNGCPAKSRRSRHQINSICLIFLFV